MTDAANPLRPRVLLVEDEPLIRMHVADALTAEGCDVIEAADAASALGLFRADDRITAVISDIGLAGEATGYDLVKAVRKERPGCTVVIASGQALKFPRDFDEHVMVETKPYDVQKLALILRMRHAEHI